jgi:heme exporter protein D
MTLTFSDGTVLSLDVFSLLAIITIVFCIVMSARDVLETWLKERRRE